MYFKDLKPGYNLYTLDRQDMTAHTIKVTNTTPPHIDAKIGGPNNLVVDITTDDGRTYVMICDAEAAYPDGMVVATGIEHILREIDAIQNTAEQALKKVEYQRETVEKCKHLKAELDPTQREKQQTEERFAKIEKMLSEMYEMQKKIAG